MTPDILHIAGQPLARGGFRDVYQHPENDDLLVKVVRNEPAGGPSFKLQRRYGIYTAVVREMREYLAVWARYSAVPGFLQHCYGFIDTGRGLGMVVEKLRGRDGGLAPSVAHVARTHGLNRDLWSRCEALYDDIRRHELVISDLNPRNILCAVDRDGQERLVVVDGLGEKTLIPFRTFSAAVNRYKTEKLIRRSQLRIKQFALGVYRPGSGSRNREIERMPVEGLFDRPPPPNAGPELPKFGPGGGLIARVLSSALATRVN